MLLEHLRTKYLIDNDVTYRVDVFTCEDGKSPLAAQCCFIEGPHFSIQSHVKCRTGVPSKENLLFGADEGELVKNCFEKAKARHANWTQAEKVIGIDAVQA